MTGDGGVGGRGGGEERLRNSFIVMFIQNAGLIPV